MEKPLTQEMRVLEREGGGVEINKGIVQKRKYPDPETPPPPKVLWNGSVLGSAFVLGSRDSAPCVQGYT